jgi:hypothetical protein
MLKRTLFSAIIFFLVAFSIFTLPASVQAQTIPLTQSSPPSSSASSSTVASLTGPPIIYSETSDRLKLNFTMFIIEFDKSAGYNILYSKNGTVLAQYHFMSLQYYNDKTGKWTQCGSYTGLSWIKYDDFHYTVVEKFLDASTSPQTNYTISYDIRSDSRIKISVRIESGATRQYRLYWSFDGITHSNWKEKKNADNVKCQLLFGDEVSGNFIALDWQDIYEQFKADIASYSVSTSAQGRKVDVYFPVGSVAAKGVLTVDPSLVGTSGAVLAVGYPFQRKSFYANGRFWVFYSDGTNMVYRTSTDGSTWSSGTAVRAASSGYTFSIWFDGTYLHYAYGTYSPIYYRRGLPNSDGTITWSAAEQTVSTTYNSANYPFVSVDSNGYVWIGYREYDGTNYYPYVIKSGNNDGTWGTTPSGFPYKFSTFSSSSWYVSIIPLTSGKMLAVYVYNSATVIVKCWSGSAWGTEVATTSAIYYSRSYSAVAQGDDVHLVFLKSTGYDILYTKYAYSSNSFGTETTLQTVAVSSPAPVISINPLTNDLYVFWAGYPTGNHIYYKKYTASSGTWENTVDWIAETETLTDNNRLTCFYQAYGSKIGLLYMTSAASPYNIKFVFLQLFSPPNPPILGNPLTNARVGPGSSVTFSWTFSDPDAGDTQSAYQLQIGNSDFSTVYADTGKVSSTSSSATVTVPSNVGLYYWRVKTWDLQNAEGAWSSGRALIVDKPIISSLSFDSSGNPTFNLISAYDNSVLSHSKMMLNSSIWKLYNIQYGLNNVTANLYTLSYGAYQFKAYADNKTIAWNLISDVEKKIDFTVEGPATVKLWLGDLGQPTQVLKDGEVWTNWNWDVSTKSLTVNVPGSEITLLYSTGAGGGGGGGGGAPGGAIISFTSPPSPPTIATPTSVPESIVYAVVAISAVLLIVAVSRELEVGTRNVSRKWRKIASPGKDKVSKKWEKQKKR